MAKLCELKVQTDDRKEQYLDMSECGVFTDQNDIVESDSRVGLCKEYPDLKHRLVVFDHYEPLWNAILLFFQEPRNKRVFLVGTPGIGKSTMRNFHAYLILKAAREAKEKCMVVMAKGGKNQHIRLSISQDGVTTAQVSTEEMNHATVKDMGYTPGKNFFFLADVSNGEVSHVFTEGLVLYSSPNQKLADQQILKQNSCRMGSPLPSKESLLRYASKETEDLYNKFGPIPRIVWGSTTVSEHETRLNDGLKKIEKFLGVAEQRDYLQGPHRFFYMDVKSKGGHHQFNLDETPPELIHAPRHVMKIVAEHVVKELLSSTINKRFGMNHKAIVGILFEEVCLCLLTKHPDAIKIKTRNLGDKKQPLRAHLKKNILGLKAVGREDVDDVLASLKPEVRSNPTLIVPKASNYPGLDAVLVLGQKQDHRKKRMKGNDHNISTAMLQMTTALDHPVSDEGINKFLLIETKMKREGVPSRNCVLFLVPENHFGSFKKQKTQNPKRQSDLDMISQLVACIIVSRNSSTSPLSK